MATQPQRPVRNAKAKASGVSFSLGQSFRCAFLGILHCFTTQRNMMIHGVVALLVLIAAALCRVDATSWILLLLCIGFVFACECLNTALEAVVDLACDQYHELARIAKDCAAGAVLISALVSVVVGLVIFIPALQTLFV